jgi:hypothetical protein
MVLNSRDQQVGRNFVIALIMAFHSFLLTRFLCFVRGFITPRGIACDGWLREPKSLSQENLGFDECF